MVNKGHVERTLRGMILSASGWRGIFAENGEEESRGGGISPSHRIIAAAAGEAFALYLRESAAACPIKAGVSGIPPDACAAEPLVVLGLDTRPTGKAIAEAIIAALSGTGCGIRYAGITAAPEIMAYARSFASACFPAGFIYISASHNPIGHNGLKFGLSDGGVLPAEEASKLAEKFRALLSGEAELDRIAAMLENPDAAFMERLLSESPEIKKAAYEAYLDFTSGVAFGNTAEKDAGLRQAITAGLAAHPLGIAVDFNGSARTLSIDREFLAGLGVSFSAMNDRPGEIRHRIIPEGESLEPCRLFLEKLHAEDPFFILGYVPDCDGDRGNLVIWDDGENRARILEAQEVFALSCVAELAHLVWTGELVYDGRGNALSKAALAVNDPTSLRIERIARAFDIPVFRAEVGEANVVSLARKLRDKGYTVRILGEGSNGGTITHPSSVRDPLDTVMAFLKLLAVRSGEKPGLVEIWYDLSGQAEMFRPNFTLADVIASLPAFVTTGISGADAQLKIQTADHGALKDRYQKIFLREWEERKESLWTRYGITGWEAAAYNGAEERRGITRFGSAGRGGLKIYFTGTEGCPVAAIWMRGSATENVFRVMADAEGQDRRIERDLVEWQRRMITEADREE
ncbi:MAG: phosphatidylglycerol lysyltransferase [Treponema sp.]|jgi:phosphoglucomutase|nr:phosphatidylglycerol lysyltransferase [Treponema sp.]